MLRGRGTSLHSYAAIGELSAPWLSALAESKSGADAAPGGACGRGLYAAEISDAPDTDPRDALHAGAAHGGFRVPDAGAFCDYRGAAGLARSENPGQEAAGVYQTRPQALRGGGAAFSGGVRPGGGHYPAAVYRLCRRGLSGVGGGGGGRTHREAHQRRLFPRRQKEIGGAGGPDQNRHHRQLWKNFYQICPAGYSFREIQCAGDPFQLQYPHGRVFGDQ